MNERRRPSVHEAWAHLRFAVVGPLLAAPPARGALRGELERLAERTWRHPVTDEPVSFALPTIERWLYQARAARVDPVAALRKKVRRDQGTQARMTPALRDVLAVQYAQHRSWSYQLHYDNLRARVAADAGLGRAPSYATVKRYMKRTGLTKRRRLSSKDTAAARRAEARLEEREVRTYEAAYVGGLWHLDFHHGSRKLLVAPGEWRTPILLGVIDDRSRLACHLQWYFGETADDLVHGLAQAIQKRGLPRALMTDNGSAMRAAEVRGGLARLGIVHELTLEHSPYQNGKQESFWGQCEGRLLAMLEGCPDLTLAQLNEATQAWVELEYHRKVHSELGETPLTRFLAGPSVSRPSPDSDGLRLAFMAEERRTQRKSDGTVSLDARRFEVPGRYRHLVRVTLRFASWDLTRVYMVDDQTGVIIDRLFPLDREKNADGKRRVLDPVSEPPAAPPDAGVAPLLARLIDDYRRAGLPPAYLPKDHRDRDRKEEEEDAP